MAAVQEQTQDLMVQSLFRSNHQLGVVARFASEISKIGDTDALTQLIQSALQDFGLSGLFKITALSSKYLQHFGNSIDRNVFSSIQCTESCGEKICAKENFILFRLSHFLMILDATNLSNEQIDETKDNLAIFSDIIDAWVLNHVQMMAYKEEISDYKIDMIKKIDLLCHNVLGINDEISEKHQTLSRELLLKLATRFPTLGLEPDQEEEVLNTIENTVHSYGKLVEDQVLNNNDIINLLHDTAEYLKKETENKSEHVAEDSRSINNQDNVVLF